MSALKANRGEDYVGVKVIDGGELGSDDEAVRRLCVLKGVSDLINAWDFRYLTSMFSCGVRDD